MRKKEMTENVNWIKQIIEQKIKFEKSLPKEAITNLKASIG